MAPWAHAPAEPAYVDEFVANVFPSAAAAYRCEDIRKGSATARWAYDPTRLRPGEFISGPTQFATADLALWYLSFTILGLAPMAVTTDVQINFLRPASGGDLLARAELLRAGKTRISGRVMLWIDGAEDRPVAHATGSYALLKRSV
ncbi:MAG: PaaI family thioesterase [Myxococcales bacterium]|nr:PaaI family thioesterase [Myxococcales bacterium]